VRLAHFEMGIHTIISDYMHDSTSKLLTNITIDLLIISLVKSFFLVFVLFKSVYIVWYYQIDKSVFILVYN